MCPVFYRFISCSMSLTPIPLHAGFCPRWFKTQAWKAKYGVHYLIQQAKPSGVAVSTEASHVLLPFHTSQDYPWRECSPGPVLRWSQAESILDHSYRHAVGRRGRAGCLNLPILLGIFIFQLHKYKLFVSVPHRVALDVESSPAASAPFATHPPSVRHME